MKEIFENYRKIHPILFNIGKWNILLIWISVLITAIIPTFSIILMKDIINTLQTNKNFRQISLFFLLYILCDIVMAILAIWSNYASMILQQKLTVKINIMIIEKIKNLELKDFESTESYNILQRAKLQSGAQVFNYFSHITNIVKAIVIILGSAFILLSWKVWPILVISGIAAVNMVFLLKLNRYQYQILRKRTGEEREKWYYDYILTNDIAFKEIKAYNLHTFFKTKYLRIAEKVIKQDKNITKKNAYIGGVKTLLEQCGNVIVIGKIFLDTYLGKVLIGSTMAYIKATSNIKSGVNNVFLEVANIYKESLYMSQLFEFLELSVKEGGKEEQKIDSIEKIKMENVNYRYKNSKSYVLKDINLTIYRGDKFVMVGKNGSGKSTLVKIIAGLYDDYEGHIWINDVDFHNIDKDSYRKCLGILFQDYNKYELNVRENVGVGNLKMINSDEKIIESLKRANAPKRLMNIDEQIGYWFNDGCQLSGGEWARLAISRIFLRDADLYILDEPNAALDPIGEANILFSIRKMICSKSCIVITHHICNVDKIPGNIVVMDKGEIIDCGQHNELVKKCSLYREMYQKSVELNKTRIT